MGQGSVLRQGRRDLDVIGKVLELKGTAEESLLRWGSAEHRRQLRAYKVICLTLTQRSEAYGSCKPCKRLCRMRLVQQR